MKRLLVFFACLALAACSDAPDDTLYGYAEGDYRLLAPETPGTITEVLAGEGHTVAAGTLLFRVNDTAETLAVSAAEARLAAAEAQFDDAAAGGREPEIAAARDQLAQARATQTQAGEDLARARELFGRGIIPRARLDDAEAAAASANARVGELRERLTLAQLPARENQLRALAANIAAAEAELDRARDQLARRQVAAPSDGRIERQLRYEGELAGPSAPVLRFLAEGAVHGLIFLPEEGLGQLRVGSSLTLSCDGCPESMDGEIVFIAGEPEFTAPILYSDNERHRLLYRAEVRFAGDPPPPGTPLRARATP
ncbi:HlyD family secretion protein [Hyphobacterium marinum]|uniref:HlyD family efflux transporter periplasmic adaptor subunit n=1 Tax=Hyphobacterium marinum TaxID=3116574 RepID=A0ABU7LWF1_9PROT|nr:HlyD family efflux transporter periplasmic adaptor subunit [Hyphobacterium sp. Y6023]MEE2565881.1 HlyD family efflux transporter periplasmic adaptor subunit [Hyphobacterium sp. Y6023]